MIYVSLDNAQSGSPLYLQLYRQIREQIRNGSLKAGERLPSKRQLSSQLHISVNTVNTAYSQLVAEGFLSVKPQSGYYVCQLDELLPELSAGEKGHSILSAQEEPHASVSAAEKSPKSTGIDFSINAVARDQFPFSLWRKTMHQCFNEYDPALLTSTPPQGDLALRRCIAEYLYRSRGVQCTADQIIIGAGNDDLLHTLSYLLGDTCPIGMENPAYHKARLLFRRMGREVISMPMDELGVQPSSLDSYPKMALYVTPSHQFPLGVSMPVNRRIQLLNWCSQSTERYLIEDDYDSEFRYQNRPIPALKSMDQSDSVIYLGTFSKSIAPSLRISYMVLPQSLLQKYHRLSGEFQSAVSRFEQAVLARFMESGHYERHLNKMRKLYRGRCEELRNALSVFGDSLRICSEDAGFYLVVQLRTGLSENEMCRLADNYGVRVYPISPYFHGDIPKEHQSKVMLGFAALDPASIQNGVQTLKKAWLF